MSSILCLSHGVYGYYFSLPTKYVIQCMNKKTMLNIYFLYLIIYPPLNFMVVILIE